MATRTGLGVIAMLLLGAACGRPSGGGSRVGDVINPEGMHETHYFGNLVLAQLDRRFFENAAKSEVWIDAPRLPTYQTQTFPTNQFAPGRQYTENVIVLKGRKVTFGVNVSGNSTLVGELTPNGDDFVIPVKFKRIDVNDMKITRQDQTTYSAEGTYSVWAADKDLEPGRPADRLLAEDMPTHTGVDVPMGLLYRVKIRAVSEEGVTLHQEYLIDYRGN